MLHQIKLRITTPVIGNTWSAGRQLYEFPRQKDEAGWSLSTQTKELWNGYVRNAAASLQLPIDYLAFRWPNFVLLPTLYLHQVPKRKGGFAHHEAISRNTILTFFLQIRHYDGERRLDAPSQEQLYEIFKFIGQYEGISPFAPERGFGLFKLLDVDVCRRDLHGDLQPSGVSGETADLQGQDD